MNRLLPPALALAALAAGAVQAHVSVQPATATVGADQLLRFVVGHGCSGQPTTALRIEVPAGVASVAAQPKAGWTLKSDRGAHGQVTAVTWSGGELGPHQPDEFQVRAHLPSQPGPLVFTAVQSCGELTARWDQPMGPDGARPDHPAPTLTLLRVGEAAPAAAAAAPLPREVRWLNGALADASGRPLYTFDFDTMAGMSHCFEDCATMWPPLKAPSDARTLGDWMPIWRDDGVVQWTYRSKPLYTFSQDRPGEPPAGAQTPHWRLAR